MLDMKGNTAAYLLYQLTRIRSVVRKVGDKASVLPQKYFHFLSRMQSIDRLSLGRSMSFPVFSSFILHHYTPRIFFHS